MAVTINAPKEVPAPAAEERSRDRSPSFPFISLEDAIARATTFEAAHRRFAARIPVVADLWKLSAKSSTMLQTIAAMKAYGLMKDGGAGGERKIEVTDLVIRILKDGRPGNREAALKEAALKPRLIAEHFKVWGTSRPPDTTCLSDLHIDEGFTEEAAARFLRVYDATISFAGLTDGDKPPESEADVVAASDPQPTEIVRRHAVVTPAPSTASLAPASTGTAGGAQMHTERVVFSQEIETPQHLLKVLVSGPVDEALLDALDDFVGFQRKRLERRAAKAPIEDSNELELRDRER
jgi:hypothetical protein